MIRKTIVNDETGLVYHLQKGSEKSGWKENVTRLFGSFQRKATGATEQLNRWPCLFRMEYSERKAIFDPSFRPSRSLVSKWN